MKKELADYLNKVTNYNKMKQKQKKKTTPIDPEMEINIIQFKWESGYYYFMNKTQYYTTEEELAKELRRGATDENKELSDDFLLDESNALGEWKWITIQLQTLLNKLNK